MEVKVVNKVKITVVKKINNRYLFGDNSPVKFTLSPECGKLEEGQEFIVDGSDCPAGFCGWAFSDIQRDITHLRFGVIFLRLQKKKLCCHAAQTVSGL